MIRCAGTVSLSLVISLGVFGQSASLVPAFEVASVKPHEGPMYRLGVSTSGSRLNADSVNLLMLVMYAYHLKNYQVSGMAPLLKDDNTRWDIVAKAEGDAVPTGSDFRQMLRSLLADRFKLEVHSEMREMAVYALVTGKDGPRLKESAPDARPMGHVTVSGRNYQVTRAKATLDDIVDAISNAFLDRPVVDKTGLTGTYEIKLTYTPDTKANREGEPDPDDIRIFAAVQSQLGLRLEPQKAMIETVVVDHAEKPSGN